MFINITRGFSSFNIYDDANDWIGNFDNWIIKQVEIGFYKGRSTIFELLDAEK